MRSFCCLRRSLSCSWRCCHSSLLNSCSAELKLGDRSDGTVGEPASVHAMVTLPTTTSIESKKCRALRIFSSPGCENSVATKRENAVHPGLKAKESTARISAVTTFGTELSHYLQ